MPDNAAVPRSGDFADPDLLSIVVMALGAVGSIASIVALQKMLTEKRKAAQEAAAAVDRERAESVYSSLKSIEFTIGRLGASLSSLERTYDASNVVDGSFAYGFGARVPELRMRQLRDFAEGTQDLNHNIRVLYDHLVDLILVLAESQDPLPAPSVGRLQEAVRGLNLLLREVSSGDPFELLTDLITHVSECRSALRDMRRALRRYLPEEA